MTEEEGVIKFKLNFTKKDCINASMVKEINAWRSIHHQLGLIGQFPDRYGGFGFGNISCKVNTEFKASYIISGTQTGRHTVLLPSQYALVTDCCAEQNKLSAQGLAKPSSEAMTHSQLYHSNDNINCVIHVHSPHIWKNAARLNLPQTRANAVYGTPDMAKEIKRLFAETDTITKNIFSMAGHQDGIVSFGETFEVATQILINMLVRSFISGEK